MSLSTGRRGSHKVKGLEFAGSLMTAVVWDVHSFHYGNEGPNVGGNFQQALEEKAGWHRY